VLFRSSDAPEQGEVRALHDADSCVPAVFGLDAVEKKCSFSPLQETQQTELLIGPNLMNFRPLVGFFFGRVDLRLSIRYFDQQEQCHRD
jgi:hypothetical protein